jgi:hypothetical protein
MRKVKTEDVKIGELILQKGLGKNSGKDFLILRLDKNNGRHYYFLNQADRKSEVISMDKFVNNNNFEDGIYDDTWVFFRLNKKELEKYKSLLIMHNL